MSNHLNSIRELADLMRINALSLDNVAYVVNKDEAEELYDEARGLSFTVLKPPVKRSQSMVKYQRLHGAIFDGVRILVIDND